MSGSVCRFCAMFAVHGTHLHGELSSSRHRHHMSIDALEWFFFSAAAFPSFLSWFSFCIRICLTRLLLLPLMMMMVVMRFFLLLRGVCIKRIAHAPCVWVCLEIFYGCISHVDARKWTNLMGKLACINQQMSVKYITEPRLCVPNSVFLIVRR